MVAYMQFHMRMKLYFKQSLYERRKPYEKTNLEYPASIVYCIVLYANARGICVRLYRLDKTDRRV